MSTELEPTPDGYVWAGEGGRCCRTHRLVPHEQETSPCLAVIYQQCTTTHRKPATQCVHDLRFRWVLFFGTSMDAPIFARGVGTSLGDCQQQVFWGVKKQQAIAFDRLQQSALGRER